MSEIGTRSRTLSRAQKVLLAVGGVAAFVLIAGAAWTLVNLFGQTTYQRDLTLTPTAGRLRIDTTGAITIKPGSGPEVRVHETVRYGLRRPRLAETSTPDGLVLHAGCDWLTPNCSIDAVVTVPAELTVDARSSGGDITVSGLTGAVQLDSSGGGITVSGLTGPAQLHSSGGGITATGLAGAVQLDSSGGGVRATGLRATQVEARSSGGDVVLAFDTAPDRVVADSSGGGVRIGLPRVEGGYSVNADSSGGGTHTDVPTDPQSQRQIEAHSSGGDVRLETTG
ncbi:MAG TPA: DUF4097 family beta strand repeat-containing protein [Pseudonocardiaceae bacterium]|jgi:hypothetical protein